MKSRTSLVIAIGLLLIGIVLFAFSTRDQKTAQILPAAIKRNCAPWDGAAFTVTIPLDNGDVIDVSIWQSPDIKYPVTFSFPDQSGKIGNAVHRSATDEYEMLSGMVSFQRVEEGQPVEGKFELVSETGKQFKGRFKADWGNQIIMCG